METKAQIRDRIKKQRGLLPEEKREKESSELSEVILRSSLFKEAEKVYLYAALPGEADLAEVLTACFLEGKRVALPRIINGQMEFYETFPEEELREGYFHVKEPASEVPVFWEQALTLTPGVVFDRTGNRYGYGKGFYDSYFFRHRNLHRAGIALECQIYEGILPVEEQDIRMETLFTAKGMTDCRR